MATVFEMIIKGDIPSVKLYEDDLCLAILDINPVEKGHTLVISKNVYPTFQEAPEKTLSHMFEVAKKLEKKMREELKCDGSNILINNGKASGQEVPHLHIHVIPRYFNDNQEFGFTHKPYTDDKEKTEMGKKLRLS